MTDRQILIWLRTRLDRAAESYTVGQWPYRDTREEALAKALAVEFDFGLHQRERLVRLATQAWTEFDAAEKVAK